MASSNIHDVNNSPFIGGTCTGGIVDLDTMFMKFKNERYEERKSRYQGVITTGWRVGSIGLLCFAISYILHEYGLSNLGYIIIAFISILFASSGFILMSTVPLIDLDLDTMATNSWWVRPCTFSFSVLIGLLLASFPPYSAFFLVINAVFVKIQQSMYLHA